MNRFHESTDQAPESRWQWLVAAHIVGQYHLMLHWRNHLAMLAFAYRQGDYPEVVGPVLRLALVPLGHLIGRLPAGNIGRATVNAFQPMALDSATAELIAKARAAALSHAG